MTQLNWLRHNRTGYRLGWRAIALGRSNERDELRAAAAPHLHQLHLHTRMITHLSVLDGRDVVWLDKLGGRCADTIATRVGGRSRADLTSEGRAMLSLLPPEHVDVLYGDILSTESLRETTRTHRRHPHPLRRTWETDAQGVSSVSAALLTGESDHVQLSCISLRGRVHQNQLQGAIPLLAATVRRVAERIAED